MPTFRFFPMFALTAALVGPVAAAAQTPPPAPLPADSSAPMVQGHHRHHRRPSFMRALRAVNLTPAQQQQVSSFHDAETKANLNADAATKRSNAAKLRAQIMGILTPDQKTQLAASMRRSHQGAPGSMPNPAMSPGADDQNSPH